MATVERRTPVHLWIVGIVAVLWNAFGAYDYLMTQTRNMDYLSSMPGVDAGEMLAWIDSFPIWAEAGWALGVWGGLAGSLLLLVRSRYAVWAFGLSLVGMALSFGYSYLGSDLPAAATEGMMAMMPLLIIAVGIALFFYARSMESRGALR